MSSVNSYNWIEIKIGEVAEVVAGGTPKAGNPDNFKAPGTGIAWLTPADLSGYTKKNISFGARDLSHHGYNSSSAKILPKGSLLFSSRAPIGYVAIAQNEISTNQGFKSFVFPYGVDSDYAYYYLKSIRDLAENLGTGTTFKEISSAKAKTLPFLLPPLAEQKVIADKIDSLLLQVDTIKAWLQSIPDILKTFRQSVLTAAISGKLTEEWRKLNKQSLSMWKDGVLADFIEKPTYGSSAKSQPEGLIPVLRMGNLQDGKLDWTNLAYTSDPEEIKKYKLFEGDVLFNRTNSPELVGKTSIFRGEKEAIYAGYLIRIICKENLKPEFLNYLLNSPDAKDYCYHVKSDGVSQSNINATKLTAYPISVPTMLEQTEIVSRIDELFAFSDNIKQNTVAALDRVNNLTQSILAKAFRGELTADWRAANPDLISGDNSANALLERIKAKLEASEKQPKAKRADIKEKTGSRMNKQIIRVVEALKIAGKPLSGQQLLATAGYPSDSSTDQLESFFLDIRNALAIEKSIVKLERSDNGQDWFALAQTTTNN
ncbi:type I restriction endonuclease subunit S [Advenella sp. S44]|uniref:restriction endonuclease subunit S n=1 Tax=Advenella sp. S44 TaxID=1982755 RepID=UPI000C2A2A1D|nr:restriction endonuclease subunit S [Advenella sp. S44]PJX22213.1 type I restriction endonuclease subunit S [Advenella sp. S44]